MKSTVHSTQIEASNPGSPCQNMVDKLGLTFGSSATSVRTTWDFTTTASASLGPQPSATHDAAFCANITAARTAQAARHQHDARHLANATLRMHGLQDGNAGRNDLDVDHSGFEAATARHTGTNVDGGGRQSDVLPIAPSNGGCECSSERTGDPNLAASLAGSGGLQAAATTVEEFTAADRQGGNVSSSSTGTTCRSTRRHSNSNNNGLGGDGDGGS